MTLSLFLLVKIAFKVRKFVILFYFVVFFALFVCFSSSLFFVDNFTFFRIYLIKKKKKIQEGIVTYLLIDDSKLKKYF